MSISPMMRVIGSAALLLPLILSLAPVHAAGAPPAPPVPEGSASGPTADALAIRLTIDGHLQQVEVDLSWAISPALEFRPGTALLTRQGLVDAGRLAVRLKARADRYLILVSNDDATPSGRAGKAGFDRAKAIRAALVREKVPEDRLVIAGWQSSDTGDGRALSAILSGPGRVMVVPVRFTAVPNGRNGDPGRTAAFDTAVSRLTVASLTPGDAAASQPQPKPVRVILPNPLQTGSSAPAGRRGQAGAPEEASAQEEKPTPGRLAAAPSGSAAPPAVSPPVVPPSTPAHPGSFVTAAGRAGEPCAPPAVIIDDYYPGGPFVPCGTTGPVRRWR